MFHVFQYPSIKKLLILILSADLDKVAKSILKSLDNSFQLPMHLRVIEFSPYLVVEEYGVKTHRRLVLGAYFVHITYFFESKNQNKQGVFS